MTWVAPVLSYNGIHNSRYQFEFTRYLLTRFKETLVQLQMELENDPSYDYKNRFLIVDTQGITPWEMTPAQTFSLDTIKANLKAGRVQYWDDSEIWRVDINPDSATNYGLFQRYWLNEIHLTPYGYFRAAERIADTIYQN